MGSAIHWAETRFYRIVAEKAVRTMPESSTPLWSVPVPAMAFLDVELVLSPSWFPSVLYQNNRKQTSTGILKNVQGICMHIHI